MDMRKYVEEQSGLVTMYVQDGAYKSALRVLVELTATVKEHINRSEHFERMIDAERSERSERGER